MPTETVAIDKASIVNAVKKICRSGRSCTMKALKRHFGLIPETEENRKDVWRLSQRVAEMLGGKRPELLTDGWELWA